MPLVRGERREERTSKNDAAGGDREKKKRLSARTKMDEGGTGAVRPGESRRSERKKTENMLRKAEAQLRFLATELSRIVERQRRRLAFSLHEEIGQSLSLIRMKLGSRRLAPPSACPVATVSLS